MAGRDQAIAAALDELVQAAANLPPEGPAEEASGTVVARTRRAKPQGPAAALLVALTGLMWVEMMGLEPTTPACKQRSATELHPLLTCGFASHRASSTVAQRSNSTQHRRKTGWPGCCGWAVVSAQLTASGRACIRAR